MKNAFAGRHQARIRLAETLRAEVKTLTTQRDILRKLDNSIALPAIEAKLSSATKSLSDLETTIKICSTSKRLKLSAADRRKARRLA